MTQNYLSQNVNRYTAKWFVLFIDIFIVSVSFFLSYWIRFNLSMTFDLELLYTRLPFVALMSLIAFLVIGSYKGIVSHTGVRDVSNLFYAACTYSILMIIVIMISRELGILEKFISIPLSIIFIHFLLSFLILTFSRYMFKVLYNNFIGKKSESLKNV